MVSHSRDTKPGPSSQNVQHLVSTLKATGSLLDKTPDRKITVLTGQTLDDNGATTETSQKYPKLLPQNTCL